MIDTESLLAPVSDSEPCGSYLKLDRSAYRSIRNAYNAAQSSFRQLVETPEASSDETLVENNTANWAELREVTQDALISKTKDLEILGWFITSQLFSQHPFANLAQSLWLLSGLAEQFWSDLNPKPPEEKLKATDDEGKDREWAEFRTRPLLQLIGESNDTTSIYVPLQILSIVADITYGDYLSAEKNGTLNALKEQSRSSYSGADRETLMHLSDAYMAIEKAERVLSEKCQQSGSAAVSFRFLKNNIEELIKAIHFLVGELIRPWPLDEGYHPASQTSSAPEEVAQATKTPQAQTGSVANTTTSDNSQSSSAMAAAISAGEIVNRDHAFKELRKIADYFRETEPHSPISFLLERAIRWGYLSLPELFEEMIGGDNSMLGHINQLTGMDNLETADLSNIAVQNRPMRTRASTTTSTDGNSHHETSNNSDANNTKASQTSSTTSEQPTESSSSVSDFEW